MAFNPERYRFNPTIPADEAVLKSTADSLRTNVESPTPDYLEVTKVITVFDDMERATKLAGLSQWRKIGRVPDMATTFDTTLKGKDTADDNEEVLRLVRVGHLLGYTHPFVSSLMDGILQRRTPPHGYYDQEAEFDRLFEEHKRRLEAKRAAAAGAGAGGRRRTTAGAGTGPRTSWGPENTTGKSPEWMGAWNDIDIKWKAAGLVTGRTSPETNTRFDAGMEFLHDDISAHLTSSVSIEGLRIRAMTEYLIPRIWTEPTVNTPPQNALETFFRRATFGRSAAERDTKEEQLARRIFLPVGIRTLPNLSRDQRTLVRRIHGCFAYAYHPDRKTSIPDIDPDLVDYVDIIFKRMNSAWDKISSLAAR